VPPASFSHTYVAAQLSHRQQNYALVPLTAGWLSNQRVYTYLRNGMADDRRAHLLDAFLLKLLVVGWTSHAEDREQAWAAA
jgi:hypothetical protein